MKKRILDYYNRIDAILKKNDPDTDWDDLLQEHLVQVSYFQHERFIHLIVTVLFGLITFMAILGLQLSKSIWFAILLVPLIILLVPYINHYYLLENTTQKMYIQYDEILAHIRAKKKEEKAADAS